MNSIESFAFQYVEDNAGKLSDWTSTIFDFAESAWREYRSAEWYVSQLQAHGFDVDVGSGGMPTAFCARWSHGAGPTIGMYAEYDAVPDNCQAAVPYQSPREGLSYAAAGHTDPHSGLGIAALGGVLATQAAMRKHNISGTLQITGEPAEKVRGSKPIHAAKGYYDSLDAMLSFHPFYMMPLCNTVRWDTHCGAAYAMIYRFICDRPQDWLQHNSNVPIPQSHSDVRAPGANDALMQMYQSSKTLRESMLSHSGGWSVSEAILTAGQATADNLPAAMADIQYMIRTPAIAMAEQVTEVLDRNAAAAAAISGCRFERHWVSKSRHGLANHAMASVVWDTMQRVGPPQWGQDAKHVAQEIQRNLQLEPMAEPFIDACHQLIDPQQAETLLRQDLPAWQLNSTSDDYTDMTWHAPTARFYVARPALKAPAGYQYPAWVMNALAKGQTEMSDAKTQIDETVKANDVVLY
ncbi:MAG: amidohydrolase, partial [Pseudomonadota bacterium]